MQYHGRIRFPAEYPFKPPAILMHTPNGRFKTDERLCLSMSDYHPETWNPMWSVSTVRSSRNQISSYTIPRTQRVQHTARATHHIHAQDMRRRTHKRTRRLANTEAAQFFTLIGRLQSSAVRLRRHVRSGRIGSTYRDLAGHSNPEASRTKGALIFHRFVFPRRYHRSNRSFRSSHILLEPSPPVGCAAQRCEWFDRPAVKGADPISANVRLGFPLRRFAPALPTSSEDWVGRC